jgi:hypothetical protein
MILDSFILFINSILTYFFPFLIDNENLFSLSISE